MRLAMADGPKTCHQLSALVGVAPKLISALLKYDLAQGRVVRGDHGYELSEGFEVQAAIALLRRNGYEVTKRRADV